MEEMERKKWKSRNIKTYKWKVHLNPAHEYDRIGRLQAPAGGLSIAPFKNTVELMLWMRLRYNSLMKLLYMSA